MRPPAVRWLPDGFAYRFRLRSRLDPGAEAGLLLTVGLFCAAAAESAAGAAVLLAAAGLGVAAPRVLPRTAELRVDHQRLVVSAPLRRYEVAVRDIREVVVHDDALEVLLWGGEEVRLPAPPPRESAWIVGRIRELRDEVQRFALEVALRPEDADRVKSLRRC